MKDIYIYPSFKSSSVLQSLWLQAFTASFSQKGVGQYKAQNHESILMRYGQISLYAISAVLMLYKVLLLDRKTKQSKRNVSEVRRVASEWLPVRLAGYCQ